MQQSGVQIEAFQRSESRNADEGLSEAKRTALREWPGGSHQRLTKCGSASSELKADAAELKVDVAEVRAAVSVLKAWTAPRMESVMLRDCPETFDDLRGKWFNLLWRDGFVAAAFNRGVD
jgi:hypothetical protein